MPNDLRRRRVLGEIDRALDFKQLDKALELARSIYDPEEEYSSTEASLLSIAFSATVRWQAGQDLGEKRIAHTLWKRATHNLTTRSQSDVADHGIRLAEIYISRGEANLAWNALRTVKQYVRLGSSSLRYNRTVDAYILLSERSDTDLWID